MTQQHATNQPMGQRRNQERNKYLETNENGSTAYQNLQYTARVVLRENHSDKCLH